MSLKKFLLLFLMIEGMNSASAQSAHFPPSYGLVGGRGIFPFLLYLGFLIFLGGSFYTKQTEFYVWTVRRGESPIIYWLIMGIFTLLAVWFGWIFWKNAT